MWQKCRPRFSPKIGDETHDPTSMFVKFHCIPVLSPCTVLLVTQSVTRGLFLFQNMTKDEGTLGDLLNEVFAAHASLQGVPAAQAELQYIKDVQLMDGYGCEFYVAKVT